MHQRPLLVFCSLLLVACGAKGQPGAGGGAGMVPPEPMAEARRTATPRPRGPGTRPGAMAPRDRPAARGAVEPARPTGPVGSAVAATDPPASVLPPEAQLPPDALATLAKRGRLSFKSRWNGQVHVKQRGRVRSLYLGRRLDIVHTRLHLDRPADLISPYQRCMLLGLGAFAKPEQEVRRVAMIGLGGGALTRFFHLKRPGWVFHSVEIDPVVVAVARAFFGVRDTPGYRSYAMDGRQFLAEARTPYDVIILDAFDAEAAIPTQLASQEFFRLVRTRLSPRGVLIINFLVHSRRIYEAVVKTLLTVFPGVVRIPLRRFASHNVLLLAPMDPSRLPGGAVLRARAARLESDFGVRFQLDKCIDSIGSDRVDLGAVRVIHDPPPARPAP